VNFVNQHIWSLPKIQTKRVILIDEKNFEFFGFIKVKISTMTNFVWIIDALGVSH